jgi:hypothetical protein
MSTQLAVLGIRTVLHQRLIPDVMGSLERAFRSRSPCASRASSATRHQTPDMTMARTHISWVRAILMSCDIRFVAGAGFEPATSGTRCARVVPLRKGLESAGSTLVSRGMTQLTGTMLAQPQGRGLGVAGPVWTESVAYLLRGSNHCGHRFLGGGPQTSTPRTHLVAAVDEHVSTPRSILFAHIDPDRHGSTQADEHHDARAAACGC